MSHTRKTLGVIAIATLMLGGCATNTTKSLYAWGNYQDNVYQSMKSGSDVPVETQIQQLEAMADKAKASDEALPPGYRAHLGLLYAKQGDVQRLKSGLEEEKKVFPESTSFVDFLLRSFKSKTQ